ncbi:MAG: GTPase Era [Gammaproteobacteria bacterium]
MNEAGHRCGYVAVVGRPNVGKSTLVNALVGAKVSIVSRRAQTTRHRITGVASTADAQLLFLDTPGLHSGRSRALNRAMNRAAVSALADADVVAIVVEAGRWGDGDDQVLEAAVTAGRPLVLVVNKVDRVWPRDRLLPYIADVSGKADFREIIPVSATGGDNLDRLRDVLARAMPEGPPLFPPEQISDRDEAFHAAEIIREKLMRRLHEELPYGLTVEVDRLQRDAEGRIAIDAVVWVEKERHKAIVIGARGEMLKNVGRAARLELKERFGAPVHLTLWVKVREGWADSEADLKRFGYYSE